MVNNMRLKAKLKAAVTGLSNLQQALLILTVSILPPVIVLLQEQSTNPFLYGAAILGGILAFAVKILGSQIVVPVPTPS
jgi:hypothetical protein